jgi:hypothetical protein
MGMGKEGEVIVESFIPGWKNSMLGILSKAGVPEQEAQYFLDARFLRMTRQLEDLADDGSTQYRAMVEQSKIRRAAECI